MAPKEKVSLSLDRDLVSEARERVGRRELSAYLNDALERRLQAESIEQYLEEAGRRVGPVPPIVTQAVDQAYARRFVRARTAKLRRRIAEALDLKSVEPSVRAEIESSFVSKVGIDLVNLVHYALSKHVPLESIIGANPTITVHGEHVTVVGVDPALERPAVRS
jgi:hypothetical protein